MRLLLVALLSLLSPSASITLEFRRAASLPHSAGIRRSRRRDSFAFLANGLSSPHFLTSMLRSSRPVGVFDGPPRIDAKPNIASSSAVRWSSASRRRQRYNLISLLNLIRHRGAPSPLGCCMRLDEIGGRHPPAWPVGGTLGNTLVTVPRRHLGKPQWARRLSVPQPFLQTLSVTSRRSHIIF